RAREVLAGDHLQVGALAGELVREHGGDLRIGRLERIPLRCPLGHDWWSSDRAVASVWARARCSGAAIWSTRRWWRPPSNGVTSQVRTISSASAGATMRPPIASTFASLCARDSRAVYRSLQRAARMPATLLAAICSPWPLPPSTIPT